MLENKFRRLALLMEPDIERMLEKQVQRTVGHDDMHWDERSGTASYLRNGAVLWQPRAEKIGVWHGDVGLYRWWWSGVGLSEHSRTRLDLAYREGQRYQLPELTGDPVQLAGVEEAELVSRLAAQLARADGVLRVPHGEDVTFVALFEPKPGDSQHPVATDLRDTTVSGSNRPSWLTTDPLDQPTDRPAVFTPAAIGSARPAAHEPPRRGWSIAPPARHDSVALRQGFGTRSIPPPVRPLDLSPLDEEEPQPIPPPPKMPASAPLAAAPIREPNREVFMPVATTALADIVHVVPQFAQALVVVRVEVESASSKGRFFVQVVCSDHDGELVSIDPSRTLLDAAAKFIGDDIRDGNGRWKKLVARLRHTPRGASVDVEVA